jgi:ATP-binding protein involved in chromosome partitioning
MTISQEQADVQQKEQQQLTERMNRVKHKIMVLSGKGGVGKSTVAANMAMALARAGKQVGLLDVDVHGPSIPKILGLEGLQVVAAEDGMTPVDIGGNLKVISVGFLIPDNDSPVIWRGPLKYNVIKQFLKDVVWGDLDYLIVDSPPGTGDEPLSVAQFLAPEAMAVIVTTPQQVAISDVRKSVQFCRKLNVDILGIIENMSGFICPHCHQNVDIFKTGGGKTMAEEMNLTFMGSIPLDPDVVISSDDGQFFLTHHKDSPTAAAFETVIEPVLSLDAGTKEPDTMSDIQSDKKNHDMIAIPVVNGKLSMHFGHCESFALVTVDSDAKTIVSTDYVNPPRHEPGVLPRWLHEQGANVIISGGMGSRAQGLFQQNGISVQVGAPVDTPENIVKAYLKGNLQTGQNICDH